MEIDRTGLFCDLLSSLERHYRNLCIKGFHSIVPLWLSRSSMIGREISVSQQGTVLFGIVKGLSTHGGLILQSHDIQRTLFAGDVTIIGT
jgi:biotin-(acetyl-CoA carboxylase) ligase